MTDTNLKFLFLLKKSGTGYDNTGYEANVPTNVGMQGKAGLSNSANFVAEALNRIYGVDTKVVTCVDGNSIDREVYLFKPDVCFIEAIWVTVPKMMELAELHPKVLFVIRVHSKTTFLANEGEAVGRIKGYDNIPNVYVSFNNAYTNAEFETIDLKPIYLPNIYDVDRPQPMTKFQTVVERIFGRPKEYKKTIDVACFGAIRPMKNQLLQGVAAIRFAEKYHKKIRFHINAGRCEQKGENVLKNLRALFAGTEHELVEHMWMPHEKFLELISKMDIGLQVSLSESFNIVTADFIAQQIPIIVSDEITWAADEAKVETSDSEKVADLMNEFLQAPKIIVSENIKALETYNQAAIAEWGYFIEDLPNYKDTGGYRD